MFDTIDRVARGDIRTRIRDILGAFMFGGEDSDKKVKVLSGGERTRLAMIKLLLEPVNCLILDEPTNHLDLKSKDVLKSAIKAFDGQLKIGHNVQIGYFAQNQAQLLDESLTVHQTIDYVAKGDIRLRINDILGAFMFGGEAADKKVKVLSGGERSRLAMIKLLLEPVNLLILDEPTNHLDMASKDVLKEAILAFDGTAIIVSHDREFLDGLVTKVYEFGGGQVREHLGGIYDFLRSRKIEDLNQLGAVSSRSEEHVARSENIAVTQRTEPEGNLAPQNEAISNKLSYLDRKEQQRKVKRTEKAVKECEELIMKLEARQKELDDILCTPEGACDMKVVSEYTELKKNIDQETERWGQLAEELETLQAQLL